MALTVGSLFSGIGGIDLGLERAGMESRWFVEWDAHCQNVLRRHWPGLPVYGDITAVDWSTVEPVDVLVGGFPCQPISGAGQQKAQADERWLWPEFFRAIRALQPRYVLVENVANLLAVNRGSAMGEVVGDLAACGYDAEWDCIPAEAVGALHLRDRLWIVAYPNADGRQRQRLGRVSEDGDALTWRDSDGRDRPRLPALADTNGGPHTAQRRQRPTPTRQGAGRRTQRDGSRVDAERQESVLGAGETPGPRAVAVASRPGLSPPERPLIFREGWREEGRAIAERGWWSVEPDVGRVADGVPHRVDRLRSLGNAVVPQVVEWIGRRIVAFDEAREVSAA